MLEFPKWFEKALKVIECPKCNRKIEKDHILAEGIRKSIMYEKETAFFIEYRCPKCDSHATIELTKMTVEDFVMEMVDRFSSEGEDLPLEEQSSQEDPYDDGEEAEKKKEIDKTPPKKSKISSVEYDAVKDMIKKCESHEEFLLNIGITPDEMEKISLEYDIDKKD
jgi:predicted nucleic-acid-binding Zn-ribbon protein